MLLRGLWPARALSWIGARALSRGGGVLPGEAHSLHWAHQPDSDPEHPEPWQEVEPAWTQLSLGQLVPPWQGQSGPWLDASCESAAGCGAWGSACGQLFFSSPFFSVGGQRPLEAGRLFGGSHTFGSLCFPSGGQCWARSFSHLIRGQGNRGGLAGGLSSRQHLLRGLQQAWSLKEEASMIDT